MVQIPESHKGLLAAPVGVLATQGTDGYPQVSALWFVYDGDNIEISLNSSRQKTKNLLRHPECTLFILDPENPYRTLEIRARASVNPDTEARAISKVQEKYGANVREHDRPGQERMLVTLHPVKFNTWG
jgi:PPOX class probable F420-dependent enzyme